jgi:hypothetical protein
MNLVLGLFVPDENKPPIWELMTDYYLHHPQALGQKKVKRYFIYSVKVKQSCYMPWRRLGGEEV